MADQYTCTGNGVRIRSGPGTSKSVIGSLYKGDVVNVVNKRADWLQLESGGWSAAMYFTLSKRDEDPTQTTSPEVATVTEEANQEAEEYKKEVDMEELTDATEYDDYPIEDVSFTMLTSDNEEYLNDLQKYAKVSSSRGIHGMPYQFLPIVDQRIDSKADSFGRKFAEKIVARMPVLLLTPGIPKFMAGFKSNDKIHVLEQFLHMGSGNKGTEMDNILRKGGRYYSFQNEYKQYFEYVDIMCRSIAFYMGIEDEELNGVKLKKFSWLGNVESDISKLIHYTKGVAFYIDSDKQISESFSNDTTSSMLKDSINGLSDYAREAQFLLGTSSYATRIGGIGAATDRFLGAENLDQNIKTTNDFINNIMLGNGGIFTRITSNIQTLVAGGKLIFPELWSDSSLGGGSYSINMKLVCPDPTPMGLYLDIMVPIVHLVCLTAPRAATANGYISPFLVRGFYKGMFNCDMGIITDLNITKGAEGSWSRDGIPTVADISFTIKDLYNALTISKNESVTNKEFSESHISNNIALLDWMANMCGINVNEHDINRQISMYLSTQSGYAKLRDSLSYNIFFSYEQWKDTLFHDIYTSIFR